MRRTNEVLRQRRDKKGRKDGENREGQEVRRQRLCFFGFGSLVPSFPNPYVGRTM
jgi:hypothetical protein